jgi:hypothetical protein
MSLLLQHHGDGTVYRPDDGGTPLHGATAQKTTIFVLTAVRTSNPNYNMVSIDKNIKLRTEINNQVV